MADSSATLNAILLGERRRTRKLLIPVAMLGVAASAAPLLAIGGLGISKHVALSIRFWGVCVACVLFSIYFGHSAITAWRNGYIITDKAIIRRSSQYFSYLWRLVADIYMALLLGPMVIALIISRYMR